MRLVLSTYLYIWDVKIVPKHVESFVEAILDTGSTPVSSTIYKREYFIDILSYFLNYYQFTYIKRKPSLLYG